MIKKPEFIPHNESVNAMPATILFGNNLGKSVSSQKSIGDLNNSRLYGQAKIGIYSNLSNGNLFIEDHAVSIDDAGVKLAIGMVYNSQPVAGQSAWRLNIGKSLVLTAADVITMMLDDGAQIIFNSTDGINFNAATPSGNYVLVKNADNSYNLTQPGTGDSAVFNAAGFEQSRTNSVGATLAFTYDSTNCIVTIDLPSGRCIRYGYNQAELAINLCGTNGLLQQNLMSYELDANSNITQSTVLFDGDAFYTSNYNYNTDGTLSGITQTDNTSLTFAYTALNGQSAVSAITDGMNRSVEFAYAVGTSTWQLGDDATTLVSATLDDNGRVAVLTKPITVCNNDGTLSPSTESTTYAYAAGDAIQTITYQGGSQNTFTYDPFTGLPAIITDGLGNQTLCYYDQVSGALVATSRTATVAGVDETIVTDYFVYDANRLLCYKISALGNVTQYQWNSVANAIASESTQLAQAYPVANLSPAALPALADLEAWWAANPPTTYSATLKQNTYNTYGQLSQRTAYAEVDANGNGVETDAMKQTAWPVRLYTGEWMEKVERQSAALSGTTTRVLDGLVRETQLTDPVLRVTTRQFLDAQQTINTTLPSGLVQTKIWDQSGLIVTESQTVGTIPRTTTYQRDPNTGAVINTTTPVGTWQSSYDQTGRLLQVTDQNQLQRQYGYDDRNHLMVHNGFVAGTTPLISQETILYDAANNIAFTIDADGYVVEKVYDESHHVIGTVTYATALLPTDSRTITSSGTIAALKDDNLNDRAEFYYRDADGNLLGKQDAGGFVRAYIRNLQGWVLTDTAYKIPQARAENWAALIAGIVPVTAADQTTYTTDLLANNVSIIDPENNLTQLTWLGNAKWSERQRSYGPAPNPAIDIIDTRQFDAVNRLLQRLEMPLNITTTNQYDVYDNVTNNMIEDTAAQPNVLMRQMTAQYDMWNQCEVTTGPRQGQYLNTAYDPDTGLKMQTVNSFKALHFFYWNTLNQLVVEVDARGYITQYTYDALGNLAQKYLIATPLSTADFAAMTGGLITPVLTALFAGYQNPALDASTEYSYDGRGLEVSHTDPASYVTATTWDAFKEVTQTVKNITLNGSLLQTIQTSVTMYPGGQPGVSKVTTQDPAGLNYVTTDTLNYQQLTQTRQLPSGDTEQFTYDSRKKILTHTDVGLNATESWTRDQLERVLSKTDFLGNTTTTSYIDSARQRTITTPMGKQTVIVQDALKRDTSVTDPAGDVTITLYNSGNDVVSRQDPVGNTTTYTYNSEGYLEATNYPGGLLVQGQTFDLSGFVATQIQQADSAAYTDTFVRDLRGLEVSHTNADQYVTTTTRDLRGLPLQVNTPLSVGTNTVIKRFDGLQKLNARADRDSHQTFAKTITNDVLGRPTTVTLDPKGLCLATAQTFDSNNRVVQTLDANGNTCWHIYDPMDRLCFDISATGIVRAYQYNALHKLSECLYQNSINVAQVLANPALANVQALVASLGSPNDTYYYYFYDQEEKLNFKVTGLGFVTQTIYDAVPRIQGTRKYATPLPVPQDMIGNLAWLQAQAQVIASALDRFDLTIYNAAGKAQYHIDAMGMVTEYVLDANYNRIQITAYAAPLNVLAQQSWTPALVAAQLNPADPNNRSKYQVFDGFNRLCYLIDEDLYVTSYTYDAMSNQTDTYAYPTQLKSVPNPINTTVMADLVKPDLTNPLTRYTSRQFDALNRKVEETDGAGYTQAWQQNALNQVIQYVDQGGYVWVTTYDNAGRKRTDVSPQTTIASVSVAAPESLVLDPLVKDTPVKINILDKVGNIITHQEGASAAPDGRKTTHTYDADRRLLTTSTKALVNKPHLNPTAPGSSVTVLVKLTCKHVYNSAGKELVKVDENNQPWFKVYDADQRLAYEVQPNGAVRQYNRDSFGEAVSITQYAVAITLPQALTNYAATGIAIDVIQAAGVITPNPALDRTIQLGYNANGQKIQTTLPQALMAWVTNGQLSWDSSAGPQTTDVLNSFGEVIQTNKLIHAGATPATASILCWRDKKGQLLATADADGYVKLYTLDHDGKIIRQHESAYQFILANLPADIGQLAKLVTQQATALDRIYVFERDVLGNNIKKILLQESVQTLALNTATPPIPVVTSETQDLVWKYTFDPRNQKIVQTTLPSGAKIRQRYDQLARPSVKWGVAFHDRDAAISTSAILYKPRSTAFYNAFSEPVANQVTFTATPTGAQIQTKTNLTLRDTRGLTSMLTDADGNVSNLSFNRTRHIARQWQWVTRFNGSPSVLASTIKQVKQTQITYDTVGQEVQRNLVDYDASMISTYTQRNLFSEAIAEGPKRRDYELRRVFNNVGKVIADNSSGGVARVHAFDGLMRKTVSLQSPSINLMKRVTNNDAEVATLLGELGPDNKTTVIQRTLLERTPRGDVIVQSRPKFTVQKPQTPEPYYTSFIVGSAYPALGAISISWPAPQDVGLIGTLTLWVHGQPATTGTKLTATVDPVSNRMGVNVSTLMSDLYDYQLLLTYDMATYGGYQAGPYISNTYAARGTSLAVITPNTGGSQNLIMQVTDDNQLTLAGNLTDPSNLPLTGVELWQNGSYVGKQAVTTQTNGTFLVDLSGQVMGTYQFKPIFKALIPIDAPVSIGQTTASGFTLSSFTPNVVVPGMASDGYNIDWSGVSTVAPLININWGYTGPSPINAQVIQIYQPPFYSNVSNLLPTATGSSVLNITQAINQYNPYVLPVTLGISLYDTQGKNYLLDYVNFNFTIAAEESGINYPGFTCQWNQTPYLVMTSSNPSVVPDIVEVTSASNQLVSADSFLTGSQIANISSVANYATQQYQLGQLDQADASVALSTPFFIRTPQPSAQIQCVELPIQNVSLTFLILGIDSGVCVTAPIVMQSNFNETCFMGRQNPFQLTITTAFQEILSDTITLGAPGLDIQLWDLTAYDVFDGAVQFQNMSLALNLRGEFVTVLSQLPTMISQSASVITTALSPVTQLYFSPLPPNVASATLQYQDTSLELQYQFTWQSLTPVLTPLKRGATVDVTSLDVGQYPYCLTLLDDSGVVIQQINDTFLVTHGNDVTPVLGQPEQFTVLAPTVAQTYDAWRNVTSNTDELGNKVSTQFNKRNLTTVTTNPSIAVTDETGTPSNMTPIDILSYNDDGYAIADTDANNHTIGHFRNEAGVVVKTVRADGVLKYFIQDGFDRPIITQTIDGRQWIMGYDLNDQILSVTDPLNHTQSSTYNEAKEQVTQTTPLGYTSGTIYDDRGNVQQTINACNQSIIYTYDRNNQVLSIDDGGSILTNGVASVPVLYNRDYFGNLDTSKPYQIVDKSGAQYQVTLDYNKAIAKKTCTTATCTPDNGAHGQYDVAASSVEKASKPRGSNKKGLALAGRQFRGFMIQRVPGDGNCFFHTVVDQLNQYGILAEDGSAYTHDLLRALVLTHVHNNPELREFFTDQDMIDLSRLRGWVDHQAIQILANLLGLEFEIMRNDGQENQTIRPVTEVQPDRIIRLLYNGVHYDSLRNPAPVTNEEPIVAEESTANSISSIDDGSTVISAPGMNLQYIRDEAGNTLYILDNAMLLTTLYHYDAARHCIGERFKNAQGMIYQDTRVGLNAMNWITEIYDTIIQGLYTYDPNGNRRSTIMAIMGTLGFAPTTIQNWYTYNAADSMLIDQGLLINGIIQIIGGTTPPAQGTLLGYDQFGRRITEDTIDSSGNHHQSVIGYDNADRVTTISVDGTVNQTFTFDANSNRIGWQNQSNNTVTITSYDPADRLTEQGSLDLTGDSSAVTTFSGYDANDNTHTQVTCVPESGAKQQYCNTMTTNFIGFVNLIKSTVSGVSSGAGGSMPPSYITNYNGANGEPVSVEGALSGDASYERFVVNAEDRIVFNQNGILLTGGTEFEWYFYNPMTKQMLGRVGNLPPVNMATGMLTLPPQWDDVNLDMNYQPVSQSYPPAGPSTYTIPPGQSMTFDDVSSLMFGDSSFGDEIAIANNAAAGSNTITQGQVVRIPVLSNTDLHNWQGDYAVYNQNAIIGTEYPNMPLPPVKPIHHSFWGELFEAIVGVVGIALDILSAGALTGTELVLAQLAVNLSTNMVQQEIGIASGMQKGFSWDSLGEAGVGSLVGSGINAAIPGSSNAWTAAKTTSAEATAFFEQAGKSEITAIFTQVLDRALRLEKNIDWGQFVTAITDTLIVPNGKVAAGVADIPLQMGQDVADTLVDDGIESLSQHQPLNAEMEAANVLGTLVGDGLVYGGRDIANNYRENTTPLADSSDTDLKLGNPLVNSLAQMNLGISGMDLTWQDIYGPAQQPSPQASNTPRNNGNANPSINSMTQQTTSAAEQAAAQASANTQAQLQGQAALQNAQAASSNSSGAWEMALAQHLYANQNSFLDSAAISIFAALSSSTATSVVNFTSSVAETADSMNPIAYVGEGFTNRDPVTGAYVSTNQAMLGVATSMVGLMSGELVELALPAASLVGSTIATGVSAGLGRFGFFASSPGLDVNVSSVLSAADEIEQMVIPDSRVAHIFRDAPGHIPDTDLNRQILQSVAQDPSTTLGTDQFGNTWSAQSNSDGSQTWVQTRNGQIINGGINLIPRNFNIDMGLSNPEPPTYS